MNKQIRFGKMLHGGDYNPEQWLDSPEILKKDIEYFKKAKINEVSMGIFSWAVLEPEEGRYEFDWMEKLLDLMQENEISVLLATPSGARPKWMADKYPEVLRVDENRNRIFFGERHNHCYTSPVYREKVYQMNYELAKRFGHHPAVIGWHLSNEYGGECHCLLCQKEFQNWLKQRYQSIDVLNKAWATTFWSHTYQNFEQIESPSRRGEHGVHGLNLDWKRFVTERTVDFVKHETKAVRDAGSDLPVMINMMYYYNGLNYHKFKDVVDIVTWDNYPTWHKEAEPVTAMDTAMQHDIMRSIQKRPFLLMESCPSATNWQSVSKLKKPGMLKAASLQAIAHGSDSVQYFQLRQSRGAFEKFHGAVIDHYGGDDTRVFQEVCEVGKWLERLEEMAGSLTHAQVAVIYDWENRWALEDAAGPRNENLFYKETVEKSYFAFRKQGLDVDVIDMEQELEGYQIVAAPMLYLFRADFQQKAEAYVRKGGKLILTYWSGIVDDTDLCYLGGTPNGLMEVAGLRSEEIDGLYDWESNEGVSVEGNSLNFTQTYRCEHLCELVKTTSAEALLVYGKDFYAGKPALTRNHYQAGECYEICADFEQDFYDDFYKKLVKNSNITVPMKEIPYGVEITSRENEKAVYRIVQNFNCNRIEIEFPKDGFEVWQGSYDGTIAGFGTVILRKQKQ